MSLLEPRAIGTRADPVLGHIAHLRHLAQPQTLEILLQRSHGWALSVARKDSARIAAHVRQGVEFLEAADLSPFRVRPLLQYYAYLNLAVACVLVYRRTAAPETKTHGASDLSWKVTRIGLKTKLVAVKKTGSIPAFHAILSGASLPQGGVALVNLAASIPGFSAELAQMFEVRPARLYVTQGIVETAAGQMTRRRSSFSIRADSSAQFPIKRINKSVPILKTQYVVRKVGPAMREWVSKTTLPATPAGAARQRHEDMALKVVNFGGHSFSPEGAAQFSWQFLPARTTPILPTLSATLLLSFSFASLVRYRPHLLDRVENSRVRLLLEAFHNEADAYVVPAFRNLLYRELTYMERESRI